MEYAVINGEVEVGNLNITFVSNSSLIMVGDIKEIFLSNAFETPPESTIVGVTLPTIEE
jgi:spore germination protein PD